MYVGSSVCCFCVWKRNEHICMTWCVPFLNLTCDRNTIWMPIRRRQSVSLLHCAEQTLFIMVCPMHMHLDSFKSTRARSTHSKWGFWKQRTATIKRRLFFFFLFFLCSVYIYILYSVNFVIPDTSLNSGMFRCISDDRTESSGSLVLPSRLEIHPISNLWHCNTGKLSNVACVL